MNCQAEAIWEKIQPEANQKPAMINFCIRELLFDQNRPADKR